jgi:hypothetical protein
VSEPKSLVCFWCGTGFTPRRDGGKRLPAAALSGAGAALCVTPAIATSVVLVLGIGRSNRHPLKLFRCR